MPSQPPESGWDFSSVIDLIESDVHDISSPTLTPKKRPTLSTVEDGGVRLGSFAKLYADLGFPEAAPLPPLDPESELSNSDDLLLPSPVLDTVQISTEPNQDAEDLSSSNTVSSKKQRQKARKLAEKERIAKELEERFQLQKQLRELAEAPAKIKTRAVPDTPTKTSRTQSRSNVGAKIRPPSPSPVAVTTTPFPPLVSPLKPKVSQPSRPSILKRSSTTQPSTPQPVKSTQVVQAVQTVQPMQHTVPYLQPPAFGTPAPLQQPFSHEYGQQFQPKQIQPVQVSTPTQRLVPRTVRPVTVPSRNSQNAVAQQPTTPTPMPVQIPMYTAPMGPPAALTLRSQVDRHFHLFHKLLNYFPDDRKWMVSPMQLINEKATSHGLHLFVDASNIMIGFKDMLRNHGIQPYEYDMSFDSLALIMERRRPVAKRFFAGSQREANPLPHVTKLVEKSRAVGYDSVMQEQVLIVREESEKKRFFNDVKKHGWHKATQIRSGSGSDSETGPPAPKTPSAPKWVEQGVDEILHLKMCQSIIDTEVPSTMVLATGDGAEAEMSDGFLAHVERALRKGWKIELISWRQQTNGGYKNKKFRAKWAEQFQIIELDDFLEDLVETL